MPSITFIDHQGSKTTVKADSGSTVMQAATDNMIEGILAECGGACACATCHCYIDETWADKVGSADSSEAEMLEHTFEPKSTSRLSCQVTVTDDMDGLVVHLPAEQY